MKPRLEIIQSEHYKIFKESKKKFSKEKLDMAKKYNVEPSKLSIISSLNISEKIFIDTILNPLGMNGFKKNLNIFGEKLFYALTSYIQEIHDQSLFISENVNSILNKRPAIERHHENHKNIDEDQELHFLLDIFSDVIEWVALESKQLTEIALKWVDLGVDMVEAFCYFYYGKNKILYS